MKNNIKNFLYFISALVFSNSAAFAAANEFKAAGFKLIKAMFGVFLSAIVIYIGILAYKRFKMPHFVSKSDAEKNNLVSSQNLDDAIEHFIKDSE